MLCRNRKEVWGVYPGVGGALLSPLLPAVRVCAREEEGRWKRQMCLLFYELGL